MLSKAGDGTGSLLFSLRRVRAYLGWHRLSSIGQMVSRVLGRHRGLPASWTAGRVGPSACLPSSGGSPRLGSPCYALRHCRPVRAGHGRVVEEVIETSPNHVKGASVIEWVLATLWGVTFTGFLLFLWPLAFLNHWLLGRAWKGEWTRTDSSLGA